MAMQEAHVFFYLSGQMCSKESSNPVRGEDGVQGRPVFRVCLKHLLDQVLQLIRQVVGEGRVSTPTHLKNQALPARRLELNTAQRGMRIPETTNHSATSDPQKNTQRIIQLS